MYSRWIATFLALIFSIGTAHAEDETDRPGVAFIEYVASIEMCLVEVATDGTCPQGRLRTLGVHRVTTGGTGARNFYVHEPALLPITNSTSPDGWPEIVHAVEPLALAGDTKDYLHISVLSSSPILQENAENAVRSTPSEVTRIQGTSDTEPGMSLQDVDVLPWEMTKAVLEILSVPGNVVLATSEEALGDAGNAEVWQFFVPVPDDPTDLQRVLKNGRYSIRISYSYLGSAPAQTATLRSVSASKLQEGFENALVSNQLTEGAPIMQSERQAMTRDLLQAVALSIDATDIALVEMIMDRQFSVLMKDLFVDQSDPMAIDELIDARSLEAVEDYLTPMYRELESISRRYEETTISEEDRRTVDVGFGVSIKGVKAGFDVKQEDINKVEEKYGVEFKATENKKTIIPHAIYVSFFTSNQVSTLNKLAFSIQVENAKIASYSRSEIIPSSMVVDPDFLGGVVPNLTYGVPVGTALCSFVASEKPPFGYQWIEEGGTWPNMALLGGLAGQPMPKMNDILIGSTEKISDVGGQWTGGQIIVDQSVVSGSSFSITGTEMLGVTTTQLNLRKGNVSGMQGFQGWETRFLNKNPPSQSRANFGRGLKYIPTTFIGQYSPNPDDAWQGQEAALVARLFSAPDSIQGSVTIPSQTIALNVPRAMPNHLKCRWMIKVH